MADPKRSAGDAGGDDDDAPSPIPLVPYSSLCLFVPPPPDLLREIRTVDPSPVPPDEHKRAVMELLESAAPVALELERAARERGAAGSRESRLAFVETTNSMTGQQAVIVFRATGSGELSLPLAELPTPGGEWSDEVAGFEQEVGRAVEDGALGLVGYRKGRGGMRSVYLTSRIESGEDARIRFTFYARLLVTAFEIAQWSEEGLFALGPGESIH
jgi:hypothetical protein